MTKFKLFTACLICMSIFYTPAGSALIGWWTKSNYCISTTGPTNACSSEFADSRTFSGDAGYLVTATAWANTAGSGNTALAGAEIAQYSGGLGVKNADAGSGSSDDDREGSTPEHSMDNDDRYDMILFEFKDQAGANIEISLEDVTVGWYQNDADISVLAYQGSGAPVLAGQNLDDLADKNLSGWEIVGNYDVDYLDPDPHYSNNHSVPQTAPVNPNQISSSYWLIGAYNSLFASAGCDPGINNNYYCNGPDFAADYLKIMDLAGSIVDTPLPPASVPEPSSLLLLVPALFITLRLRRQRAN